MIKRFTEEFKKFLSRGSAIDLAVGVIIGAAFTKIVNSLAEDVIAPLISVVTPSLDFSGFVLNIWEHPVKVGSFITNCINFLIMGFALFLIVKALNRLSAKKDDAPAPKKNCPFCKTEIHAEATRCPQCTSEI